MEKPIGAYTPNDILFIKDHIGVENTKDYWEAVRPETYSVFFARLKMALDVLTEKADALYWFTPTTTDKQ